MYVGVGRALPLRVSLPHPSVAGFNRQLMILVMMGLELLLQHPVVGVDDGAVPCVRLFSLCL